jgi:tetratricopeptide (TPR) repeat protein
MDPLVTGLGEQLLEKLGSEALKKAARALGYAGWQADLARKASREAEARWARKKIRRWLHIEQVSRLVIEGPHDRSHIDQLHSSLVKALAGNLAQRLIHAERYQAGQLNKTADKLLTAVLKWLLASLEAPEAVRIAHEREMAAIARLGPTADRRQELLKMVPSLARRRFHDLAKADDQLAGRLLALLVQEARSPSESISELLRDVPSWVDSGPPQVWAFVGEMAGSYADVAVARDCFKKAAEEGAPGRARWMARAALASASAQEIEASRELGTRALQLDPHDRFVTIVQLLLKSSDAQEIASAFEEGAADADGFPVRIYYAVALCDLGRLDEGISVVTAELELDPELTGTMIMLAELLLRKSERERGAARQAAITEAARWATKARDKRREWRAPSGEAVEMMIQTAIAAGDLDAIARYAQPESVGGEASSAEAAFPAVAYSLAMWAVDQGRRDLAMAAAQRMDARSFERLMIEGSIAHSLDHADEKAGELLGKALEAAQTPIAKVMAWRALATTLWPIPRWHEFELLAPEEAEFCLSVSLINRGEYQEAIGRLRPHALTSRRHSEQLARAYEKMGQVNQAVETLRTAGRTLRDPDLDGQAALVLARAGRHDEAIALAREALAEVFPSSPMLGAVRRALAELLWKRGDWAGAAQQAEAVLTQTPSDVNVRWMLVGALFNQHRHDDAWHQIETAKLAPRNLPEAIVWLVLVPRYRDQSEWFDQAIELVRRYPTSAELGQAFLRAPVVRPGPPVAPEKLQAAQAATADVIALLKEAGVVRAIEASEEGLKEIDQLLSAGADQYAALTRQVTSGLAPVGALSSASGRSCTEVWVKGEPRTLLISSLLPAVRSEDLAAAKGSREGEVVVDVSSLAVLSLIPTVWNHVMSTFRKLVIPSGARDDVLHGREVLTTPAVGFMTWDNEGRRRVFLDLPESLASEWRHRSQWMAVRLESLVVVDRRALSTFPQLEFVRFAGWLAAPDLAIELGYSLYSDDLALRLMLRARGITTFGTVELLNLLAERARLTGTEHSQLLEVLRAARCGDLPIDVGAMLDLAEKEAWQPGIAWLQLTRPGYWADGSGLPLFQGIISRLPKDRLEFLPVWLQAAIEGFCQRLPDPQLTESCALLTSEVIRVKGERSVIPALVEVAKTTSRRLGGGDPRPALGRQLRQQLVSTVGFKTGALLFSSWLADVSDDDRAVISQQFFA